MFVASVVLLVCTAWTLAGLVAIARTVAPTAAPRRESLMSAARLVPVSVLKPLAGVDADLEANIESFLVQDHPDYEVLFGVHDATDPAILVVERVLARHPNARARLIVHASRPVGNNPKVDNLRRIVDKARFDWVLVSDSNVRAPRHYLSELATEVALRPNVGLVTNLFAGVGERTLGAALDNVQLNGFCAAGATLPSALGDPLVVGKSMLFSRSTFDRIGGLERVANLLAEDFVIGKMFQHAGLAVVIAPTVLANPTRGLSVSAFVARHLRWSMIRWRLRPFAALLEPLTAPLALLPLAIWAWGIWGVAWVSASWIARDVGGWLLLRGSQRVWIPLLLAPVRDLTALAIWIIAPFKRHVTWRGRRVRMGAGTLLFSEERWSRA